MGGVYQGMVRGSKRLGWQVHHGAKGIKSVTTLGLGICGWVQCGHVTGLGQSLCPLSLCQGVLALL